MSEIQGVTVWHIGRCGSTVLGRCLNQHSGLHWNNEIFNPWMPARRNNRELPSVEEVLRSAREKSGDKISISEIKFLSSQHPGIYGMNALSLLEKLMKLGYKKHILLQRRNILKRMISHCRAFDTGIYHVEQGGVGKEKAVIPYIMPTNDILVGTKRKSLIEWITEIIAEYECIAKRLKELDASVLYLTYEQDIEDNPLVGYYKVCDWLDLPIEHANVDLQRTSSGVLQDTIGNYNELMDLLLPLGYSWMVTT